MSKIESIRTLRVVRLVLDCEKYMREALELAREAAAQGEVPVGCVVFDESGAVIGRGRNRREELPDAGAHATLEPCPMCAGAVINARLSTVIYGAKEPRSGSVGSVINLFEENYGHRPAVYGGVLSEDCARLLAEFFRGIR